MSLLLRTLPARSSRFYTTSALTLGTFRQPRNVKLPQTVTARWNSSSPSSEAIAKAQGQQIRTEAKLQITFTCTAENCDRHRSTHEFSRNAYEKGIVLVQCPSCNNRHLIADHLGWFDSDDLTQGGKFKTIEALLAAKGENVKRGHSLQVDKHSGEEIEEGKTGANQSRVEIGQIVGP